VTCKVLTNLISRFNQLCDTSILVQITITTSVMMQNGACSNPQGAGAELSKWLSGTNSTFIATVLDVAFAVISLPADWAHHAVCDHTKQYML
jgi:hypothetical protein